ncbi:hypothetical protein ACFV5N_13350 [Streptomyces sp. NPDC059853]|uniref:hypothetical protein n=1 Tax=Streptomyces sp. NPDC059853 TaxID=3346973 RepID=UPI003663A473
MNLELLRVTEGCNDERDCPALYRTDRGTVVARGWKVADSDAIAALELPEHEGVVELPADLVAEVLRNAQ